MNRRLLLFTTLCALSNTLYPMDFVINDIEIEEVNLSDGDSINSMLNEVLSNGLEINLHNPLTLRQLILLDLITTYAERLDEKLPVWIHSNYQEDLRVIAPLLETKVRFRCHLMQSSFIEASTSENTAGNILADTKMKSLKQLALQHVVNRLLTCSLVDPCSIDNQIQQLRSAASEIMEDIELMLKKINTRHGLKTPLDTLTLKQLILLSILNGHSTPLGLKPRNLHQAYLEDYRIVTSFLNYNDGSNYGYGMYRINVVDTPTIKTHAA